MVGGDGVLSDVIHTQEIHSAYGGIVPELASRAHADKVVSTVRAALERAGLERPDAVAATAGPGLMGAVLVGFSFAKALAAGWDVPFVGVNHLEGHLLSPLLERPPPSFPYLCLLVSGGHSTLYLVRGLGDYVVLGQTIDDAAGEAYDKVARMMGRGYPGGPVVDRLAQSGDPAAVAFPRSRPGLGKAISRRRQTIERRVLDLSFSGLKTAVRQHLESPSRASDEDVAASFQQAVVDVLIDRIRRASKDTGVKHVAIAGGVAANSALRAGVVELAGEVGLVATIPPRARCTDNGSMIAHAGRLQLLAGRSHGLGPGARAAWMPGQPLERQVRS